VAEAEPSSSCRRARCSATGGHVFWSGQGTSGVGRLLRDLDCGSCAVVLLLPRKCVSVGCMLTAIRSVLLSAALGCVDSIAPDESLTARRAWMSPSSLGAVVELFDLRCFRVLVG
jgi:hypothetical protein